MKNIDTDGVTKPIKLKEKDILEKYTRDISGWEIYTDRFNVLRFIGGDLESKMLNSDNTNLRIYWKGFKKSGAHKIDTGSIKLLDALSGKKFAVITVEEGYAKKIRLYRKSFAENLDNYKNMPLYSYIKETLA